jgi:predicted membrane GTPase involved in stress response
VERIQIPSARAGDIVSVAGINAGVTDTLSDVSCTRGLETSPIDPPTLKMSIGVNRRAPSDRPSLCEYSEYAYSAIEHPLSTTPPPTAAVRPWRTERVGAHQCDSGACSSPFVGKEGTIVNGTQIEARCGSD